MPPAPIPIDEPARLAAVRNSHLLDTPPDPRFDALTRAAATLFETPMAGISVVDTDRLWFKSVIGLPVPQVPRDAGFCPHAILQPDFPLVVEDTSRDRRFADNPFVAAEGGVRFYAGAPYRAANGQPLGTLCIAGMEPRALKPASVEALANLAVGVESLLVLARNARALELASASDPLTGLANRATIEAAIHAALAGGSCALLNIDLRGFREVNSVHGHETGDRVLREAACRLLGAIRACDMAARLSGSIFAVMIRGPVRPRDVEAVAESVMGAFAVPFPAGRDKTVRLSASIGIAVSQQGSGAFGSAAADLLRRADVALYQAREYGRAAFRHFRPAADRAIGRMRALESDLRDAVERARFDLHWQKIADVRGLSAQGYEALIRWNRGRHGPVSPATFIPVAERVNLINRVDAWVLRTACAQAVLWDEPLDVAVNVSAGWFREGGLPDLIAAILTETKLDPARLEIEVTERVLINDDLCALREIERLRAQGVRIALDDFGTGYSSLSYLEAFPFDKVKLDRSFIRGLGVNARAEAIVRAVLTLCQDLGVTTCAEGVELERQRAFLRAHRCDLMQGYLIGRPEKMSSGKISSLACAEAPVRRSA